jgi:hypothetical protein
MLLSKQLSTVMQRDTIKALKDNFNSPFWVEVRRQANIKIDNATRADGTLDWSKLPSLLSVNPKVEKGIDFDYLTNIFHGAPSFASLYNSCASASLGCGLNCLNESGHGQKHMMNNDVHSVHVARVTRTMIWFRFRDQFKAKMQREIRALVRKAKRMNLVPVVRPNGTTDFNFESLWPELFTDNTDVTFYDYTKNSNRDVSHIPNYSLSFSVSETNLDTAKAELARGLNVVMVLRLKRNDPKPDYVLGYPTINGDIHDLRFLDDNTNPHVVCLFAKGHAYKDKTGFVYDLDTVNATYNNNNAKQLESV